MKYSFLKNFIALEKDYPKPHKAYILGWVVFKDGDI